MKGMAILLVDDEPLIRLSMVDALEAVGYDVHAVAGRRRAHRSQSHQGQIS
jgi:CheY-like chemotaxis protein